MIHECTARFDRTLFEKYLPGYTIHSPVGPSGGDLLSPEDFGWPMSRPRLFTVMTKDRVSSNSNAVFGVPMNMLYSQKQVAVKATAIIVSSQIAGCDSVNVYHEFQCHIVTAL